MGTLIVGLVVFLASLFALVIFMGMATKIEMAKIEKDKPTKGPLDDFKLSKKD